MDQDLMEIKNACRMKKVFVKVNACAFAVSVLFVSGMCSILVEKSIITSMTSCFTSPATYAFMVVLWLMLTCTVMDIMDGQSVCDAALLKLADIQVTDKEGYQRLQEQLQQDGGIAYKTLINFLYREQSIRYVNRKTATGTAAAAVISRQL